MFVICSHEAKTGVTDWISCNRDNYQRLITPKGPFRHAGDWLLLCRASSDIILSWKLLGRRQAEYMLHVTSLHASHRTHGICMEIGWCISTQLTVQLYISQPLQTAEDKTNLSHWWCQELSTEMQLSSLQAILTARSHDRGRWSPHFRLCLCNIDCSWVYK